MSHYALSIDEFTEEVFHHLERGQDGGAGHYARFDADTIEQAIDKATACLRELVAAKMYESDDYGYRRESTEAP